MHGRSLAADEARWRASRLAAGSRGFRSQEARTRLHFWMSESRSSLRLSRDRCKKLLRFFTTYFIRSSTFGHWHWSAAQNSAIECTRYLNMGQMREMVL